jgi:hypothetical protein
VANSILCGATCPCNADGKKWGVSGTSLVTKKDGYNNFPECPTSRSAIAGVEFFSGSTSGNITMGFNALGAVEKKF